MALHDRRLTATYRLQMNAGFTFAQARARVPYFERLGVSHLYLSPISAARRGSVHGYDVVDPTRINSELGTEDELRALAKDLHVRRMGLIVDIVPNHMGIGDENLYWDDVLTHGERSRYAKWFDIEWAAAPNRRALVLPVLGDELERVLERGELGVKLVEGQTPRITYFSQSFPIDPASLPPELQLAQVDAEEAGELANLYSGREGANRLEKLLDAQHYRLVFWRRNAEINYRRFFDVNDLAAVRVEDPTVFAETHALVLRLVHEGVIDGLRVDHIDGLLDPAEYLSRLRAATSADTPIFVEKILSPGEALPETWPVDGTTGYEFLNDVEAVFLDAAGAQRIEAFYRRLRRLGATTFQEIARTGKTNILTGALRPDLDRLTNQLARLARGRGKRWTAANLGEALVAFIAAFPVYRSYIDPRSPANEADLTAIHRAARDAIGAGASSEIVDFIAEVLVNAGSRDGKTADGLRFAQRLQQVSGPATAKGVEDTALYVYVPVTSRLEVGGEPDEPISAAVASLHQANVHRAARWPRSLLATNTHDTKRSADVRARLDALTEQPAEWDRSVRRWRRLNAKHRQVVKGRLSPDTNTEYLMYQIVAALWPPPRLGRRSDDLPDRAWRESARERLTRYAIKAAREAKTRTSWTDPDVEYERALTEFVANILEPADDAPFLSDVARLVSRVAPIGAWNALSRIAIHLTAPGTPDIYQGDELWNLTLVDPDNRRQVDYDAREHALDSLASVERRIDSDQPIDVFDSRVKLLATQRLLCLRRTQPDLFVRGAYERLVVSGPRARHVFAFARVLNGKRSITLASRLLGDMDVDKMSEWWLDTTVKLPHSTGEIGWRSQILHGVVESKDGMLELASTFAKLPVAVLVN